MSEERDPNPGAVVPVPPQPQPVRLEINAQGMSTTYANFFRVAGTYEELLVDFGFHTGIVAGGAPEAAKVGHRMVMTFPTAKRLLAALHSAIQRHEQAFGPIETNPQNRVRRS